MPHFFFDKFIAFLTYVCIFFIIAVHTLFQIFYIFHFILKGSSMVLIVTDPCHCLSLTFHDLILVLFILVN